MADTTTVIRADAKGGLLDQLFNKGSLPEVKVKLEIDTLISLAVTAIVTVIILMLLRAVLKTVIG